MRMTPLLAPTVLVLILTACQSTATHKTAVTGSDSVRVACSAFRLISYDSEEDTKMTVDEIRQHNAAYKALCSK